jgi:hypothetical protein
VAGKDNSTPYLHDGHKEHMFTVKIKLLDIQCDKLFFHYALVARWVGCFGGVLWGGGGGGLPTFHSYRINKTAARHLITNPFATFPYSESVSNIPLLHCKIIIADIQVDKN